MLRRDSDRGPCDPQSNDLSTLYDETFAEDLVVKALCVSERPDQLYQTMLETHHPIFLQCGKKG